MGEDRAGLIAMLSRVISNAGYNIIDIEQSAPHGLFYIIMVIEPTSTAIDEPIKFFNNRFDEIAAGTNLSISIGPFKGGIRKESKNWLRAIFVGPDQPGMISAISDFMGKNNANIHRLNMISRGQIIASEMLIDISGVLPEKIIEGRFNEGLKGLGKTLGVDIIIEEQEIYKKKRKLLILDLDENMVQVNDLHQFFSSLTILNGEKHRIAEVLSSGNYHEIKKALTPQLEGMNSETLNKLLELVKISPGTEELIRALKLMNYTIALISSSLNQFTELIKDRLNLEYAFGNALHVKNGLLTGNFISALQISQKKKDRLVDWLATMEKVPEAEIYQFGLEEKDPVLSQTADLKVVVDFDYETVKRTISSDQCTPIQFLAILANIGVSLKQLEDLKPFLL